MMHTRVPKRVLVTTRYSRNYRCSSAAYELFVGFCGQTFSMSGLSSNLSNCRTTSSHVEYLYHLAQLDGPQVRKRTIVPKEDLIQSDSQITFHCLLFIGWSFLWFQEPSYISSCIHLSSPCLCDKASFRCHITRCCWFRRPFCNTNV